MSVLVTQAKIIYNCRIVSLLCNIFHIFLQHFWHIVLSIADILGTYIFINWTNFKTTVIGHFLKITTHLCSSVWLYSFKLIQFYFKCVASSQERKIQNLLHDVATVLAILDSFHCIVQQKQIRLFVLMSQ